MMQIGFMGNRELFEKNREIFYKLKIECKNITSAEELQAIDGLMISSLGGEGIEVVKKMYREIRNYGEKDTPIWGIGYGGYLLTDKNLALIDCHGRFRRRKSLKTSIISVPSWQERFAVNFYGKIELVNVAPNIAILCEEKQSPIILRQGNVLACTYMAELCKNKSIYAYFAQMLCDGFMKE